MVSSQGLTRGNRGTPDVFHFHEEERPIGVQLFGSEPGRMADSAAIVAESGPDFMDINFSCPARKIVTRGAGCALMRDPEKAGEIAGAVARATELPVTAKIRLGWDKESMNAGRLVAILADKGVAAVAVHGRTWKQGFSGAASWDEVAKVKRTSRIPVILSGDIFSPEAARRGLEETGCDAVMVARGAYGRPWIFRAILRHMAGEAAPEPTAKEKQDVILAHLDLAIEQYGEKLAVVRFRKHLLWYTKGMRGVVALRPAVSHIESRREIVEILSLVGKSCKGDAEWTAKQ
jgi:tRNA-dihydrouridine synthase B